MTSPSIHLGFASLVMTLLHCRRNILATMSSVPPHMSAIFPTTLTLENSASIASCDVQYQSRHRRSRCPIGSGEIARWPQTLVFLSFLAWLRWNDLYSQTVRIHNLSLSAMESLAHSGSCLQKNFILRAVRAVTLVPPLSSNPSLQASHTGSSPILWRHRNNRE